MTSRIVLAAVIAAVLFGAGYAIADPAASPGGGGGTDAAPQALKYDEVKVQAGLTAGTPATLRPAPTPRPRRAPTRSPARTSTPAAATTQPRAVPTPRPSIPAPVATTAPAPRPTAAPRPRPAPTAPPDYVGSGFDDSG